MSRNPSLSLFSLYLCPFMHVEHFTVEEQEDAEKFAGVSHLLTPQYCPCGHCAAAGHARCPKSLSNGANTEPC